MKQVINKFVVRFFEWIGIRLYQETPDHNISVSQFLNLIDKTTELEFRIKTLEETQNKTIVYRKTSSPIRGTKPAKENKNKTTTVVGA